MCDMSVVAKRPVRTFMLACVNTKLFAAHGLQLLHDTTLDMLGDNHRRKWLFLPTQRQIISIIDQSTIYDIHIWQIFLIWQNGWYIFRIVNLNNESYN